MSLKHTLLPTMQRGDETSYLALQRSDEVSWWRSFKCASALSALILVTCIVTSAVITAYNYNVMANVSKEKVAIVEIHNSVKEIWNKIQMHQTNSMPTYQALTADFAYSGSDELTDSIDDVEDDKYENGDNGISSDEELGENSFNIEDLTDVESSGDYDDMEESDFEEDDSVQESTDDTFDLDETEDFSDEEQNIGGRSKRSAKGTLTLKQCKKSCRSIRGKERKSCQKECNKQFSKTLETSLKVAHFVANDDNVYFAAKFDTTVKKEPCKFFEEMSGTLCGNRSFMSNIPELKIFKPATWTVESSSPAQLDGGYKAIVKESGIYLVYAQALLFGNAPTKGLQVMKKQGNSEELVSACQNGVHPELSRSDSTLDQTCFTQTVLKLNKGESIEMHTTAQAIEVGTGTFFGLVKLSGI